MLGTVEIVCQRMVKAKTVEHALRQILPRKIVSECISRVQSGVSESPDRGLVELISECQGFEPSLLLTEVTQRLGMEAIKTLHLPSPTLLGKVGIGVSELRRVNAIPQYCVESKAGYCLAVADPSLVAISDFELRGITVKLALASQVSAVWQQYETMAGSSSYERVDENLARITLVQLLSVARQRGASGVTIGRLSPGTYELPGETHNVSGRIHSGVYWALIGMSRGNRNFSFSIDPKLEPKFAKYLTGQARSNDKVEVQLESVGPKVFFNCFFAKTSDDQFGNLSEDIVIEGVVDRELEIDIEAEPQIPFRGELCGASGILVVDDDQKFGLLLVDLLTRRGYRAVFYKSLAEVKHEFISKGKFCSLIICDVHLSESAPVSDKQNSELAPELDSIRLARGLFPDKPLIFLTSDLKLETKVAAINAGADAYLGKCDEQEVLLSWISNLLSRKKGNLVGSYV